MKAERQAWFIAGLVVISCAAGVLLRARTAATASTPRSKGVASGSAAHPEIGRLPTGRSSVRTWQEIMRPAPGSGLQDFRLLDYLPRGS